MRARRAGGVGTWRRVRTSSPGRGPMSCALSEGQTCWRRSARRSTAGNVSTVGSPQLSTPTASSARPAASGHAPSLPRGRAPVHLGCGKHVFAGPARPSSSTMSACVSPDRVSRATPRHATPSVTVPWHKRRGDEGAPTARVWSMRVQGACVELERSLRGRHTRTDDTEHTRDTTQHSPRPG